MPRPRLRVCSTPGCPHLQPDTLCAEHRRARDTHYRHTTPTKVHHQADRARRAAFVKAHKQANGDWCPGWGVPAHTSADLTADHITEIAAGGSPTGPLQVLCRACNSRKANTRNA